MWDWRAWVIAIGLVLWEFYFLSFSDLRFYFFYRYFRDLLCYLGFMVIYWIYGFGVDLWEVINEDFRLFIYLSYFENTGVTIWGQLVTTHHGGVLLKSEVMGSRLTNNLIMELVRTHNRGVGVGALQRCESGAHGRVVTRSGLSQKSCYFIIQNL